MDHEHHRATSNEQPSEFLSDSSWFYIGANLEEYEYSALPPWV
jgi:hypothetical protein